MKRYIIRVFYEGSNYYGYQRQPDKKTVEGTILEALHSINYIESPAENHFRSASRTDRYVGAIGNVFAFNTDNEIKLEQLNAALPKDKSIECWGFSNVNGDFSPKYSIWKKYWYVLPLEHVVSSGSIDLGKIKKICSCFEGKNDFRLFCKVDHRDTKREIKEINVVEKNDCLIFEFISNSFLWEQVRRIVGYVLNYTKLSDELQNTEELLSSESSISALNIEAADPRQLILVEHHYDSVDWTINELAVERITNKMNKYLNELERKEKTITSIHDFFISRDSEKK